MSEFIWSSDDLKEQNYRCHANSMLWVMKIDEKILGHRSVSGTLAAHNIVAPVFCQAHMINAYLIGKQLFSRVLILDEQRN